MSIGPLVNLANNYIQSLMGVGSTSSTNPTTTAGVGNLGSTQDTNQLSPVARFLGTLQQLQQSNPSQYRQVTQQIANNLQTAAGSATSAGDTSLAGTLTQLSTDFSNASSSGQLPNIQDLAQAIAGGHRHHHHGNPSGASASGGSASSSTATGNLNQFLQSIDASQTSASPLSIVLNTLSGAGVGIG